MQAVSGYLMAKDSYGKGANEFALRTVTGKVRFSPSGAIPPMREGDMITVVVAGNAICAISDLTTGAEFRYQPMPPYRSEKISVRSLLLLNAAIGLLPIIGYLMAKGFIDPIASIIVPWALAWLGIGTFLWRRLIVNNLNVRITNEVQDAVKRSLLDTSIWDIPEYVEGEEQK
jgi:hypothetical protein